MKKVRFQKERLIQINRFIVIIYLILNTLISSICLANQNNTKDGIKMPKATISIRPATSEEEFDIILSTLHRMPFFRQHGYDVVLPDNEKFKQLGNRSTKISESEKDELYDFFSKNIYDRGNYEKGLEKSAHMTEIFNNAIPILYSFKRKWGFKLLEHYDVILTRYGVGGQYDPMNGKLFLKTNPDGHFKRSDPAHTLIHEIIHIGIDEDIIKAYHLTHWEKERVVDLICALKFDGLIKNYKIQPWGEKNLDPLITKDSIMDLPNAIESYVRMYPRENETGFRTKDDRVEIVVVDKIFKDTQAEAIGLKKGDIIYKYDGNSVTSPKVFLNAVKSKSKKKRIEFVVIRKSKVMQFFIEGGPIGIKITKGSMLKEDLKTLDSAVPESRS